MKRKYTTFLLCVLVHIARVVEAKSSKKGVCIPPGEKFHCGDLAALHNVRWPRHVAAPHVARHVSSWWYNWHVTPNHEMEPPEDFCTCDTGTCGPVPKGERQEGQSCAENPPSVWSIVQLYRAAKLQAHIHSFWGNFRDTWITWVMKTLAAHLPGQLSLKFPQK